MTEDRGASPWFLPLAVIGGGRWGRSGPMKDCSFALRLMHLLFRIIESRALKASAIPFFIYSLSPEPERSFTVVQRKLYSPWTSPESLKISIKT